MPLENNTPCVCGNIECVIPFGYCHCGCGEKTSIAKRNSKQFGYIKGEPARYVRYHHKVKLIATTEYAVPFKIEGAYCRTIPLTKGQFAIVWESDYEWLSKRSWCAHWDKTSRGFYARCGVRDGNGKLHTMSMHRMILGLDWNDEEIGDHRNRCGLDNRRSNLRITNEGGNAHNRKRQISNTSGYKGVRDPRGNGVYCAFITYLGKLLYLGCDRDPYKAHLLYVEASKKYFGEFARSE